MKKLKIAAITIGVFAGLGGATHGPGEILLGNVAPSELVFKAWPGLSALGGEPAMSVVPNFIVTGVLTILVGVLIALWAGKFVERRMGGLMLALLSVVLQLVGGGIVPPFFGVAAGILGMILNYKASKGAAN
jgi:hypothetical protein